MRKVVRQGAGEAALWDEFRAGSLEAFTALYNAHVRALYGYGRKFTPDPDLMEDCIQDLFVDLWKKREGLGPTDSPKYYLFAALRNRIIRLRQTAARRPAEAFPEEYEFEISLSPETCLINDQTSREQQLYLEQAIGKLSRRQREAVYLKFFECLSYDEVARVMQLELRSVYNLVSKALETLKQNAPKVLTALLLLLLGK
jgi:RNA polymerase sigma factor (sigma-70 family)